MSIQLQNKSLILDKWLFWSDRASGKTWLMSNIANELSRAGYKVTYVSGSEEPLRLEPEITYLWCSSEDNSNYAISVLTERAKSGSIDFLIIDDFELTGFRTIVAFAIPCNILACVSHSGSSQSISEKIPISILGNNQNMLEIISEGKINFKDFTFRQTFNSNKTINYGDIVNKYIRDKKIEQLI